MLFSQKTGCETKHMLCVKVAALGGEPSNNSFPSVDAAAILREFAVRVRRRLPVFETLGH